MQTASIPTECLFLTHMLLAIPPGRQADSRLKARLNRGFGFVADIQCQLHDSLSGRLQQCRRK
jgi:hypothetical protein